MKVPAMSLFELVRLDGRGGSISGGATQYGKYKFNPSTWMLTVGRKF